MRVGLFVPCYVDWIDPDVAIATVEVLEHYGVEVDFPQSQTCCGQPFANTGHNADAAPLARRFGEIFADYEHIVSPSGSCVAMVRRQYPVLFADAMPGELAAVGGRTRELCEFLVDVLGVERADGAFPHRVALQESCHGLRELGLGVPSERADRTGMREAKVRRLLGGMAGLEWATIEREDECCGFGGSFAVAEDAISARMGRDRVEAAVRARAEVLAATDLSCLIHLSGVARRDSQPLAVMHVAQLLAGRALGAHAERHP